MEGSEAVPAAAQGEAAEQATETPTVSAEEFAHVRGEVQQMRDRMAQFAPEPDPYQQIPDPFNGGGYGQQPPPEQAQQGYDNGYGYQDPNQQQLGYEQQPDGGYGQVQQDPNVQALEQRVAALTSRLEAQDDRWTEQEYAALAYEHPELRDRNVNGPLLERWREYASDIGADPNRPPPAGLLEDFYLAQKAKERAQQETPAGGDQQVHLESGAGQSPPQPEEDRWEQIVAAGRRTDPFAV